MGGYTFQYGEHIFNRGALLGEGECHGRPVDRHSHLHLTGLDPLFKTHIIYLIVDAGTTSRYSPKYYTKGSDVS